MMGMTTVSVTGKVSAKRLVTMGRTTHDPRPTAAAAKAIQPLRAVGHVGGGGTGEGPGLTPGEGLDAFAMVPDLPKSERRTPYPGVALTKTLSPPRGPARAVRQRWLGHFTFVIGTEVLPASRCEDSSTLHIPRESEPCPGEPGHGHG